MIASFLNKTYRIKKLVTNGNKKRYTATATVDGDIQDDQSMLNQIRGAEYQERYTGFFETEDAAIFKNGRLVIDDTTGIEYTIDKADIETHPITGTSYLECVLVKQRNKTNGDRNE